MRVLQLGICASTPAEFLAKAKEIVMKHQQLQSHATQLQQNVTQMEHEQQKLVTLAAAALLAISDPAQGQSVFAVDVQCACDVLMYWSSNPTKSVPFGV